MRAVAARIGASVAVLAVVTLLATSADAHIDVVRISLSQLYLGSDVAGIVRIDAVEDRDFSGGGAPALREVLTGTMLHQYKGEARSRVHFILDAHGPAHYRAGDVAALFLVATDADDPLHRIGPDGPEVFVSRQVRNSEHRLAAEEVDDYRWVFNAYAAPPAETSRNRPSVAETLMYMLRSGSDGLAGSALIDWQNLGPAVGFTAADVDELLAITRRGEREITLRLAVLKTLNAQNFVGPEAWDYLFEHETGNGLREVIRATRGHEDRRFLPYLTDALDDDAVAIVDAAARALAHPVYRGVEPLLEPLLWADDLRMNYAAVAALVGIDSPAADDLLALALRDHGNRKVRRMISARLRAAG